jgi:hypothetical protein
MPVPSLYIWNYLQPTAHQVYWSVPAPGYPPSLDLRSNDFPKNYCIAELQTTAKDINLPNRSQKGGEASVPPIFLSVKKN